MPKTGPYTLSEYFQNYGRYLYKEKWDRKAINLLYQSPKNKEEIRQKDLAKKLQSKIRRNLWQDIESFEISKNGGRTYVLYHGNVGALNCQDSVFIADDGNSYSCRITLKPIHPLALYSDGEIYASERGPDVDKKWVELSIMILEELYAGKNVRNIKELQATVGQKYAQRYNGKKKVGRSQLYNFCSGLSDFWNSKNLMSLIKNPD